MAVGGVAVIADVSAATRSRSRRAISVGGRCRRRRPRGRAARCPLCVQATPIERWTCPAGLRHRPRWSRMPSRVCPRAERGRARPRPVLAAPGSPSTTCGADDARMSGDLDWLAGLSPWPEDGFGLDRMDELLAALGDPQLRYPAVHVVGTNGKSTATVAIEQMLLREGLGVGSTVSPHVRSWAERIRIGGRGARSSRSRCGASVRRRRQCGRHQFWTITAAAFAAFAAGRGRRCGRGGRAGGALRRDERHALPRRSAHERRARAHRRSRRDDRGDCDREARCCPF